MFMPVMLVVHIVSLLFVVVHKTKNLGMYAFILIVLLALKNGVFVLYTIFLCNDCLSVPNSV
jgi:hypothetical protein